MGKERTFIGAIDQGTTSSRFLIFDNEGSLVASYQTDLTQNYPQPGWIEHDPDEICNSVTTCIEEALKIFTEKGYSAKDIKVAGLTNQRETAVVWDSRTGKALHRAIVWSDTRTSQIARELRSKEGAEKLRDLCGLPLSTYPSSVKVLWMLQNVEKVKSVYEEGYLAFGTVDSWLLFNLTGGSDGGKYVTDFTNASRTMFMNIRTLQYDDYLLKFFGIEKIKLPKLVSSSDPEAYGKLVSGTLKGTRITSCLGDQSAALVGQLAFSPGMAKNTYGTGCFLLYNTGTEPVISKNGLLTTVAFAFKDEKPVYALEGSIAVAGSAISFLKDNLGLIKEPNEVGELASKVKDSGGVVFVTAFSGLFAPYWIEDAKGTIFGITGHTTREHICRATLEATCYQTKAILNAMVKDSGQSLKALAVDGGMSNSDVAMQLQADTIGIDVDRPEMRESTALGAAIAAGYAAGIWKSLEELKGVNSTGRQIFKPTTDETYREAAFDLWEKAVSKAQGW